MRIVMTKEAFNREISLLASKPTIELRKKLVRCYVWSNTLYGSETWTLENWRGSSWRTSKCGTGEEYRRFKGQRK